MMQNFSVPQMLVSSPHKYEDDADGSTDTGSGAENLSDFSTAEESGSGRLGTLTGARQNLWQPQMMPLQPQMSYQLQPVQFPFAMQGQQTVMYMMAVASDGTQQLIPMMQPQAPSVYTNQFFDDETLLEKKAAKLEAYAEELKAEAFRVGAAAAAATRRANTQEQPRRRLEQSRNTPKKNLSWADEMEEEPTTFPAVKECVVVGDNDDRTTLMFRNLPNEYTRTTLTDMLDSEGFGRLYSFVYVPTDFKRFAGFGYAFVSFANHQSAVLAMNHFGGFKNWKVQSQKVCEVDWSGAVQGLVSHTERYRNSPVMHHSVPDEYKPAVFVNGIRVPFPTSTRPLRPPRQSGHHLKSHRD